MNNTNNNTNEFNNNTLSPILIQNENTKIALYGISFNHSNDLLQTFFLNNLQIKKPQGDEWVNILMVHIGQGTIPNEQLQQLQRLFQLVIIGGCKTCVLPDDEIVTNGIVVPGSPCNFTFDDYDEQPKGFVEVTVREKTMTIKKRNYRQIHRMVKREEELPEKYQNVKDVVVVEKYIEKRTREIINEIIDEMKSEKYLNNLNELNDLNSLNNRNNLNDLNERNNGIVDDTNKITMKLTYTKLHQDCHVRLTKISSLFSENVLNYSSFIQVRKTYRNNALNKTVTFEKILNEELDQHGQQERVLRRRVMNECFERIKTSNDSSNIRAITEKCYDETIQKTKRMIKNEEEKGMESAELNDVFNLAKKELYEEDDLKDQSELRVSRDYKSQSKYFSQRNTNDFDLSVDDDSTERFSKKVTKKSKTIDIDLSDEINLDSDDEMKESKATHSDDFDDSDKSIKPVVKKTKKKTKKRTIKMNEEEDEIDLNDSEKKGLSKSQRDEIQQGMMNVTQMSQIKSQATQNKKSTKKTTKRAMNVLKFFNN